jgi:hypothetical protein
VRHSPTDPTPHRRARSIQVDGPDDTNRLSLVNRLGDVMEGFTAGWSECRLVR